ncbi:hypothetical protein T02_15289 [Trichinella nativa]|uniref:Uncharacterized protein n=1 Tax=Trichinella nativa TaxID=6335 RepID=A0A0V1KXY3_9BILA|nr:hypothetical protein T02_15289 [Trichinella nativa]
MAQDTSKGLKFIFTKKFQCTKTGFQRCTMQITIAIKVPYRQKKSENAVDTKRNADGTKQNTIKEEKYVRFLVYLDSVRKRKSENADDTKQITDDTKRIADGTKQNKKRQKVYVVPRGSQFCRSGLGILRKGEVIP